MPELKANPEEQNPPADPAEAIVDQVILRAGSERAAIRALVAELRDARAAADTASYGFTRGLSPRAPR